MDAFDRPLRVCGRELRFELNRMPERPLKVRLYLYSPFEFSHPYWYGRYTQSLKIHAGQRLIRETALQEGANVVGFDLTGADSGEGDTIVRLEFTYHSRFDFFTIWRIAALLEKIEVDAGGPEARTYSWELTSGSPSQK